MGIIELKFDGAALSLHVRNKRAQLINIDGRKRLINQFRVFKLMAIFTAFKNFDIDLILFILLLLAV